MPEAGECIREVAWHVIKAPCWLNADLSEELRMETRVSSHGIAAVLLQATSGQAKDLDARSQLEPLPQATGEDGELRPAQTEGTA